MFKSVASSVKCVLHHSVFRVMRTQKAFHLLHALNPIAFFAVILIIHSLPDPLAELL
jgi:hypothetical protein